MTRTRLRDARSTAEEAAYYQQVYPQGYKHDRWPDHVERVAASVDFLRRWSSRFRTAADLSCGDGAILRALTQEGRLNRIILGDLNKVPELDLAQWRMGSQYLHVSSLRPGPLPDTLWSLPDRGVDLFVLSETLEHMDDPDALLTQLLGFSQYLFISTPVDETAESGNLEHYWGWGTADVHEMLQTAGWDPLEMEVLVPQTTLHLSNPYRYQLWLAVNR